MNEKISKAYSLFESRGGKKWDYPILLPLWKIGIDIPPLVFLAPVKVFLIGFSYFFLFVTIAFYFIFEESLLRNDFWKATIPRCFIGSVIFGAVMALIINRDRRAKKLPTWDEFEISQCDRHQRGEK
ncbi:DUF6404 family protein [Paraburkholderia megapolitana]|uniref:DUF6404 family protein n=1 Tax=Paraburkholderia megapolitana TaxID=420953 RepID=UPI001160DA8A|nr:DUF6404 family protein [Paraburkholderia megapolitana]QDQ81651.1 hypothetical protein FNZ07_11050 [Paraburkholderia megapolitana]